MAERTGLVTAVLIASMLPSHVQAHDLYSALVDAWGKTCCDDRDCHPVSYRFTARGVQMFVAGQWIDVPPIALQYRTLPGDTGETAGGHWCGSVYRDDEFGNIVYTTRCAILPPNSASAH
jgi:hypothetical protein